jgi:flavin-dependent dehydrogenase
MYDVIIVGARCAGAPLAMLLAREGHRVALVDRASFPSDTMSTHFLWPRGVAKLASWGLVDRLSQRGCEPIRQVIFDVGAVQLVGTAPPVEGVSDSLCPRRTVLDALLVEAAVDAGAELIDRFVVSDLCWADGRVSGLRGHQRGSRSGVTTLSSSLVVGADGLHSTVADQVMAPTYCEHAATTCVYYSYWSGIADRAASFHARPGQLVLVWPTNDDLTCIYVAWPASQYQAVKADVEGAFVSALTTVPELAEKAAAGRREHRFVGTRELPNRYRTSAGPGWALVGDAGHHKDPSTGMGISDAFLSADLLAQSITGSLDDPCRLDEALVGYQKRRDALTANGFHLTLSTARLDGLAPRLEEFYRAAAVQPQAVSRVFGVLGGTTPVRDVYSAEQIGATIDAANGTEGHSAIPRGLRRDSTPRPRQDGDVDITQ